MREGAAQVSPFGETVARAPADARGLEEADCSSDSSPLATLAEASSQRAPYRPRAVRLKVTARPRSAFSLALAPSALGPRLPRFLILGTGARGLRPGAPGLAAFGGSCVG